MTDYEQELTDSFDWAGLRRDCVENAVETLREYTLDDLEAFELTDGESVKGMVYIGSVFELTPSGKYYMPFACSNVEVCPDCGGDGHMRPICETCTPEESVNYDGTSACEDCPYRETRHDHAPVTETCPYCLGEGQRSISELAEIRKETPEVTATFLVKTYNTVIHDDGTFDCRSCNGSGTQFVTCPTCDGMGSAEAYQDSLWQEALDKVCEDNGFWNESGEGNPCDCFVARWVSFDEIVRYLLETHLDVVTAWLKSEETIKTVKSGLRAVKSAMNKIEQLESEVR